MITERRCSMRGWALRALEAEAAEGGREENIEDLEREQAVKGRRGKRPHFANFSALLAMLPPLVALGLSPNFWLLRTRPKTSVQLFTSCVTTYSKMCATYSKMCALENETCTIGQPWICVCAWNAWEIASNNTVRAMQSEHLSHFWSPECSWWFSKSNKARSNAARVTSNFCVARYCAGRMTTIKVSTSLFQVQGSCNLMFNF